MEENKKVQTQQSIITAIDNQEAVDQEAIPSFALDTDLFHVLVKRASEKSISYIEYIIQLIENDLIATPTPIELQEKSLPPPPTYDWQDSPTISNSTDWKKIGNQISGVGIAIVLILLLTYLILRIVKKRENTAKPKENNSITPKVEEQQQATPPQAPLLAVEKIPSLSKKIPEEEEALQEEALQEEALQEAPLQEQIQEELQKDEIDYDNLNLFK